RALLSAVPVMDASTKREVIRLQGELPSPVSPPAGCHFHPRCPEAFAPCRVAYPGASRFSPTHSTHCHLYPADPTGEKSVTDSASLVSRH
ncbi:MAG: oligopeptide/dipeptide ABC transporter ATP-binding protein, partial [Burkholderiales bacterium]